MTDIDAVLAFKADTSDLERSEAALKGVEKQGAKTEKVVDNLGVVHKKSATAVKSNVVQMKGMFGSLRNVQHAAQNSAFQIQDFVVQVQSGTQASRALSQQLPQLLGAFGAGGAILGVFAGLGAAAFAPLIDDMFDTRDASDLLAASLEDLDAILVKADKGAYALSDTFAELAKRSAAIAEASIKEEMLASADALDEANKKAVDLAMSLSPSDLGGRFSRLNLLIMQSRIQLKAGSITIDEFNERINRLFLQTGEQDPSKAFRDMRKELASLAEDARKLEERRGILAGGGLSSKSDTEGDQKRKAEIQKELEKNQRLAEIENEKRQQALADDRKQAFLELRQVEESLKTREQRIVDAAARRRQMVQDSFATIGEDAQRQADLEVQIEADKSAKLTALREQMARQAARERALQLLPLQNLLGDMAGLMSSESLKLFRIGQAASITTATMKGYEAAVSAYAYGASVGGPTGGAIAATLSSIATGAQIAQIAKQKPPGRFQGGQVRAGGQYIVGERGPEMIEMGSSGGRVIPSVGETQPMQVINNIKVIGGTAQDATATTTGRQVSDTKFVQDIVVDMMVRPNSPGRRGMAGNSNLVNRGSM